MNLIYVVYENIDKDGGYGDAVHTKRNVHAFPTENEAKAYVESHSDPHIYARPHDDLWCGGLDYEALTLGTLEVVE